MTECLHCGGPHPWWECRKLPEGWKPGKARPNVNTGAGVNRQSSGVNAGAVLTAPATPSPRPASSVRIEREPPKLEAAGSSPAPVTSSGAGATGHADPPRSGAATRKAAETPAPVRRKGDRHKPGYMAEYQRQRRARQRGAQA